MPMLNARDVDMVAWALAKVGALEKGSGNFENHLAIRKGAMQNQVFSAWV